MTTRREALALTSGAFLAASPGLAWAKKAQKTPAFDWSLGLDAWLEGQRIGWRVPGLAVAMIKDGQIVYQKGFGLRDVSGTQKVDENTLFRGASTTKALGAASIALLVDEGKLAWDAPISSYIPEIKFAGGDEYRSISLRDMLSHRTGLPRHELLWYNNQTLSRAGLVPLVAHLDMSAPLRSIYQYNNLMYVLAGHALERVSGQSWEAFTQSRLLGPIGMTRANLSVPAMAIDPNHAVGHQTNAARQLRPVQLRHDPLLGPAGALNASISDYAKWAQFLLRFGQVGDNRLISKASMAAMWEPMLLTAGTPREPEFERGYYGLGWRIDRYRDTVRIAHGGDLNGFTSRVVLLPQKNVALVVLVNHGGHPLPNAVTPDLLDRLLGLEPEDNSAKAIARRNAAEAKPVVADPNVPVAVQGTSPSRSIPLYAGTYRHSGYGDIQVTSADGGLRVSYNDMPARLAHWHYDVFEVKTEALHHGEFNGLKLAFHGDEAGKIASLTATMQDGVAPIVFALVG